jgi:hypothetical protein
MGPTITRDRNNKLEAIIAALNGALSTPLANEELIGPRGTGHWRMMDLFKVGAMLINRARCLTRKCDPALLPLRPVPRRER